MLEWGKERENIGNVDGGGGGNSEKNVTVRILGKRTAGTAVENIHKPG
jgi:hypothetical protein